jgi:hypothetical protein
MNDMLIEFEADGNHYTYEMHEIDGERLKRYIMEHPNEPFTLCVIMCGELLNMYPLQEEVSV